MFVIGTFGSGALKTEKPVKFVGAKPLFLPAIGWEGLNSPEIGWPEVPLPGRGLVGVLWARAGSEASTNIPTAEKAAQALSEVESGERLPTGRS